MRLTSVLFAVSVVLSPLAAPADEVAMNLTPMTAPTVNLSDMASMDREFGRFHLTPLGVRNTIDAAGSRFNEASTDQDLSSGSFALAVDALRDWEHRFPRDPMVPRDIARIAHVYARLHSPCAHAYAVKTLAWLSTDYPASAEVPNVEYEITSDETPAIVDRTFADLASQPMPISQETATASSDVEFAEPEH